MKIKYTVKELAGIIQKSSAVLTTDVKIGGQSIISFVLEEYHNYPKSNCDNSLID